MDPTTAVAAVTGKEIAKNAEPYFALLLKPSAELLGKELKDYIEEKLDAWKKERRKMNLSHHLERGGEILTRLSDTSKDTAPPKPNVETSEAFQDWMEGAQDVDPEDADLACIWQMLLVEITLGKTDQKFLVEKLRSISASEARVIMRMQSKSYYPKSEEELHYLESLNTKEIVSKDYMHISFVAASSMVGLLFIFGAFGYEENSVNSRLISSIFWQISGVVVIVGYLAVRFRYSRGLAYWKPTWTGKRLLAYARRSASISS